MPYSPFLRCSVSTHSLARRLTYLPLYNKWGRFCFNSQPRKEADVWVIVLHRSDDCFNSQPRKEADNGVQVPHIFRNVSTHSLARRLTCRGCIKADRTECFNSQPRKEADGVSPSWITEAWCFNSQPRKEADSDRRVAEGHGGMFQLTASQGG